VTAIIASAGLISTEWMTEEARDKGTDVHLAARYWDENDLAESSVSAEVLARLESYRAFLADLKPTIMEIERDVSHRYYGYAGRPDRILSINGCDGVLDIKGTTQAAWHGVQLAAYAAACWPGIADMKRWSLYLSDDSYKLVERDDPDDWKAFLACLTLHNWRTKHP